MSLIGFAAIKYRGIPVIVIKPIDGKEFNTISEFGELADEQNHNPIIVTREGWAKYESLLFAEKDLEKFMHDKEKSNGTSRKR